MSTLNTQVGDTSLEGLIGDDNNVYAWWAEIIASVVLFFAFVATFYFTIAAQIEGKIVTKQINIIVDDFTSNVTAAIPSSEQIAFKNQLQQYLVIDPVTMASLKQQDVTVSAANKQLLTKAIEVVSLVCVIGAVLIIALYFWAKRQGKPFGMKKIMIHVLIVTAFVAITEFTFLTLVGESYQTADPNVVKKSLVESIIQFGQTS